MKFEVTLTVTRVIEVDCDAKELEDSVYADPLLFVDDESAKTTVDVKPATCTSSTKGMTL